MSSLKSLIVFCCTSDKRRNMRNLEANALELGVTAFPDFPHEDEMVNFYNNQLN